MANLTEILNLLEKKQLFFVLKLNFSLYWSLFSPFRPKVVILPI